MARIPLVVLAGPTASGKSDLAVLIAQHLNGEVVSADSMQVYKYMDIGTAKVSPATRALVPHHLLDLVSPEQPFSLALYQELAVEAITDIWSRGKLPLLTGGTGLYIKAVVDNYPLAQLPSDSTCRQSLLVWWSQRGPDYCYNRLQEIDPAYAARVSSQDKRRVLRALEVYELTGKTLTSIHKEASSKSPFDPLLVGLTISRQRLYDKINKRAEKMLELGLVSEYLLLLAMGVDASCNAMQGLGYRHAGLHIKGLWNDEELLDKLQQDTRRYAKRQLTWFRGMEGMIWLDNSQPAAETVRTISTMIAGKYALKSELV